MKIKLLGVLLFSTLLFSTLLSAGNLHWEKDLQSAFDKATANKLPLMVMVESSSCRWCVKMKRKTLGNDEIATRLQNFVLVKIDRDIVSSEFVPYAKYVPTIYFMTSDKKMLESITGYFGVSDFHSWIDDAENKLKKAK